MTRALALSRIVAVADALPPAVRAQVVFIGGTVLPLLVDVEARFDAPRVTRDVDAVMATVSYTRMGMVEEALREAKFRHDTTGPISRWRAPNGEIFDLSTAGAHPGGTGAVVDDVAIATAIPISEHPHLRQLSAVGYFLMKTAAFADRGATAPHASKDLSDLGVLLVGCASLERDAAAAADHVRALVRTHARAALETADMIGALRTHFRDRQPIPPDTPVTLADQALAALTRLATD